MNEEFQLYDTLRVRGPRVRGNEILSSSIRILRSETLPDLRFRALLSPSEISKMIAITPFNPNLGYQIDQDDFDPEKRFQKNEIRYKNLILSKPYGKNQDALTVHLERKFLPQDLKFLRSLRMQLYFPNLAFESSPRNPFLDFWEFSIFYPLDTGPLPEIKEQYLRLDDGFCLVVPRDLELEGLQQIRAKFVLASQQTPKK